MKLLIKGLAQKAARRHLSDEERVCRRFAFPAHISVARHLQPRRCKSFYCYLKADITPRSVATGFYKLHRQKTPKQEKNRYQLWWRLVSSIISGTAFKGICLIGSLQLEVQDIGFLLICSVHIFQLILAGCRYRFTLRDSWIHR